jgi:hypothetical protein
MKPSKKQSQIKWGPRVTKAKRDLAVLIKKEGNSKRVKCMRQLLRVVMELDRVRSMAQKLETGRGLSSPELRWLLNL